MNNDQTTNQERIYEVCYCYHDGEYEYRERTYCRGTKRELEREVREELREFAGDDDESSITWTYEDQNARKGETCVDGFPRLLEVSARTIDSLDDLDIWPLSRRPSQEV